MTLGAGGGARADVGAQLDQLLALKASCFAEGIGIEPEAERRLSRGGAEPLTVHEYATTGGITLELPHGVYVNAPFDEWFCSKPRALLRWQEDVAGLVVAFEGHEYPARVLPLPGYLGTKDAKGRLVEDVVMSHADRARLSPVTGCAFTCGFCDLAGKKYASRPLEQLLAALDVAKADARLPVRHLLISGGTPATRHREGFEELVGGVASEAGMPTDVMMAPSDDGSFVDRLVDRGVTGFALNIEIFGADTARRVTPQKARIGRETFRSAIARAVERTGGRGRVRSLLVTGLEPMETTLEGVEFLARMGCDPVLSPFRPARGTPLHRHPVQSSAELLDLYEQGLDIARSYGVQLGPRCGPCQHNTLTLPAAAG